MSIPILKLLYKGTRRRARFEFPRKLKALREFPINNMNRIIDFLSGGKCRERWRFGGSKGVQREEILKLHKWQWWRNTEHSKRLSELVALEVQCDRDDFLFTTQWALFPRGETILVECLLLICRQTRFDCVEIRCSWLDQIVDVFDECWIDLTWLTDKLLWWIWWQVRQRWIRARWSGKNLFYYS